MDQKTEAKLLILRAIQGCSPAPYNKTAKQMTDTEYQFTRRFIKRFLADTEKKFNLKAPEEPKEPSGR